MLPRDVLRMDIVMENLEKTAQKYKKFSNIKKEVTFQEIYDNFIELENFEIAQNNETAITTSQKTKN